MVHYAHIQWGRASIIELVRDVKTINVFVTCENDPRNIADLRALMIIFNAGERVESSPKMFVVMKQPETYVN